MTLCASIVHHYRLRLAAMIQSYDEDLVTDAFVYCR